MSFKTRLPYQEIWLYNFIFQRKGPVLTNPICLVGGELKSEKLIKIFQDDLNNPPFEMGENNLFISYYTPNELHCHLSLEWSLPKNIIDLFPEYRCLTNGLVDAKQSSLSDALTWFNLSPIDETLKSTVESLLSRGEPWSQSDKQLFLDYGQAVLVAQFQLLEKMEDWIIGQLATVLQRSRYMVAVTKMENYGVPIDTERYNILKDKWNDIRETLVLELKESFSPYDKSAFKIKRFEKYLESQDIPWSKTNTGRLNLTQETFAQMGEIYPQIKPYGRLKKSLSKLNKLELPVGSDGRSRCNLRPFMTTPGRNAPSSNKFIFNLPKWLRHLIKPRQGHGLAYLDWSYQEVGVAAALSQDSNLKRDYLSGDPYLAFAKKIGAIPLDATKESHASDRSQFKEVVLAILYGLSASNLSKRIKKSLSESMELLRQHRIRYPDFWKWSDDIVMFFNTKGILCTTYGWSLRLDKDIFNELSIRNFPVQANGGELLRIACIMAMDNNIKVIATAHDGFLIEFPLEHSEKHIDIFKEVMIEASRRVLSGFELHVDILQIFYPDRFKDPGGHSLWLKAWDIVSELETPHR